MDLKPWILHFIWLCLFPSLVMGQNYRHIGLEDGLNEREGGQALMDRTGLMWLTTNSGLHTFDGYEVKHFKTKINTAGDRLTALVEDKNGNIWYRRNSALIEIDLYTHVITEHFINDDIKTFFFDYDDNPIVRDKS